MSSSKIPPLLAVLILAAEFIPGVRPEARIR